MKIIFLDVDGSPIVQYISEDLSSILAKYVEQV